MALTSMPVKFQEWEWEEELSVLDLETVGLGMYCIFEKNWISKHNYFILINSISKLFCDILPYQFIFLHYLL